MAATVIDSLVVEIGLDPTKYRKGMADALADAAKGKDRLVAGGRDVEAATNRMGDVFSKLRTNVLGLAALFTAGVGLKAFVSQTTETNIGVGRMSNVVGMSTQAFSKWRGAGLLANGTAESFTNILKTITLELAKLQLTGESSVIPYFRALGINVVDGAGKMKNASTLLLEVADQVAAKKIDPARATLLLQSMGADEASIAAIMKGRAALQAYLDQAGRAGVITPADVKAAQDYNNALKDLELSSGAFGRELLTAVAPGLTAVAGGFANLIRQMRTGEIEGGAERAGILPQGRGSGYYLMKMLMGEDTANRIFGMPAAGRGAAPAEGAGESTDVEGYIRQGAARRGINPDVAVAVAKSEGLTSYVGDRGSSFGPFQLHYGGVASGGMAVGGLGDEFTKKTGLDARDKATVQQQVDFALDYAAKNGWSAWHGWRGAPFAGIGAGAGVAAAAGASQVDNSRTNTSTADVKVDTINIHTQAREAGPIAGEIGSALRDASFGVNANGGPN